MSVGDVSTISLDIETYGSLRGQPPHTVFVPPRSVFNDGVPTSRQVLTVSLTWPKERPVLTREGLASMEPASTMVLHVQHAPHLKMLADALREATTIIGCNLLFDLLYLRAFSPTLRLALDPFSKTLVELTVLSFLENDVRPSHSLKAIARDYNIHHYQATAADQFPTLSAVADYNAVDTHVTLLCAAEAARRIPAGDDRLSPECLRLYSDTLWSCLAMTENGVPHSIVKVRNLREKCLTTCARISEKLLTDHTLILEGEGRDKSRQDFLERLLALVPEHVRTDPKLLEYSEKTGALSWKQMNRALLKLYLPTHHEDLHEAIDLIDEHASSLKLLTSYINPLVGRGQKKNPRKKMLVAGPHGVHMSYPVWLLTPSRFKDSPLEGGTRQARITCIDPGHQTDPPEIEACRTSRWRGGILVSMDLSQHELRTAGVLSGEPAYLDAYTNNQDLHGRRALSIWGRETLLARYHELADHPVDAWRDVCKPFKKFEGQVGKRGNFADLFRAGPDIIQHAILGDIGELLPRELFVEMVDRRRHERPVLWEWQERTIKDAHALGRITLPETGQTRSFLGGDKYDVNEIVNFPVQATAANTLLSIQNALARRLHALNLTSTIRMFLNVYDALKFDVVDHAAVQVLRELLEEIVADEQEVGYWARTCERTGFFLPLAYDIETKESPP